MIKSKICAPLMFIVQLIAVGLLAECHGASWPQEQGGQTTGQRPAQESADGSDQQQGEVPADAIEIADEPTGIDPIEVLPEQLTKPFSIVFEQASLKDVIAWLRAEAGISVMVDEQSLDAAGILPNELITDKLDAEPLYLLLDRLRSVSIGWRFEKEGLHLESIEEQTLYTAQYNIGSLVDAGYEADKLLASIQDSVFPKTWEKTSGLGSIMLLGDVLFVRQTNDVHRQIAGLLKALGTHGRRTIVCAPASHAALRESLAQSISIDLYQSPLVQVVQQLAQVSDVDVRLDQAGLKNSGIRERVAVDLSLDEQPLNVGLDVLTGKLGLAWVVRDGVVWVTNRENVPALIAVYDVRDLCRNIGESAGLKRAIVSQTVPESWSDGAGDGTIFFPLPGTMVVQQPEELQNEVLELLENYRSALRVSKRREQKKDDPKEVLTRYYRMPSNIAVDLETRLPMLLKEGSWQDSSEGEASEQIGKILRLNSRSDYDNSSAEAVIEIPHSVLVITHRRYVHQEIARVLNRVNQGDHNYGEWNEGGGFGGGGFGGGGSGFGGGYFSLPESHGIEFKR